MPTESQLGEILAARRLITQEQLQQADQLVGTTRRKLGQILIDQGYISEEKLLHALAAQHHMTPWMLEKDPPEMAAVHRIPIEACVKYQMLPVQVRGDLLLVAYGNCPTYDVVEAAKALSGMRVEPVLASEERLQLLIEDFAAGKPIRSGMERHVAQAMSEMGTRDKSGPKATDVTEEATRPVIGIVNQILADAIRMHASDIHVEPFEDKVEVRFRIDGQLIKLREIPQELHSMLVTRIKIMSELDVVEYRAPQDGRMSVALGRRSIDVRVSVLPNVHGQRIVLRILDRQVAMKALEEIGFTPSNLQIFRSLIHKPYGLFLVTGPTGSGKTTTLYSALREVQTSANNVMTCEDPVEYELPGIAQSQVNEKVGLTFATQLRAILRQDPDVILVGEVRDSETATTAIRAALTGHMVFSTLHCNDALSAVPRLMDMGVEPSLLATCLIGVQAQRLVRTLCPKCKAPRSLTDEETRLFSRYRVPISDEPVFTPVGCNQCYSTGYRGRVAVHEIIKVDRTVESLIAQRASMEVIGAHVDGTQYSTLQADALERVLSGVTSLEEVRRVVYFDDL
ncbi:MAG: Flp pilus assembly complex ATPase component TadA [Armatimonadetes bacterium]|nr:Flp pilus assembly complex ATPase component TadA [Armatimonadota bacterium]